MKILGIAGGLDPVYSSRKWFAQPLAYHDAAAVLVESGKVVRAIEEERLNRIKHTNKAPVSAMKFCLAEKSVAHVDKLAVYGDEAFLDQLLKDVVLFDPDPDSVAPTARDLLHEMLYSQMGEDICDAKLVFVPHHMAHATAAYAMGGEDNSLIVTLDGQGDSLSGMVLSGIGDEIRTLRTFDVSQSLGVLYLTIIRFIGFDFFDEYKVMALAPYGDARRYRDAFRAFYELRADGNYVIRARFWERLYDLGRPRRPSEPVTQFHSDIAAALQETLEHIVFHVLQWYKQETSHKYLCMAGGVAHNCALTGKILYSGLFERVFIHPASHDAGCAIGAALHVGIAEGAHHANVGPIKNVYWGSNIETDGLEPIVETLGRWSDFIEVEHSDDISMKTASLMAAGHVVGWVQGRSEFGPRALGNRSILADPRPAANKEIINGLVKKREAFRPFAPVVLEEYVREYFEVPSNQDRFPFMMFVVRVNAEKRSLLGAVTHVDGTARLQTVSRSDNPQLWQLIEAFRQITGVPVLLNTSFNNNVEPIVNSVDDAIVCLLTTGLEYVIVGNYVVTKKRHSDVTLQGLVPSLPRYVKLIQARGYLDSATASVRWSMRHSGRKDETAVSAELFRLLAEANGMSTISELLTKCHLSGEPATVGVLADIRELWSRRLVSLVPKTNAIQGSPCVGESEGLPVS